MEVQQSLWLRLEELGEGSNLLHQKEEERSWVGAFFSQEFGRHLSPPYTVRRRISIFRAGFGATPIPGREGWLLGCHPPPLTVLPASAFGACRGGGNWIA